MSQELSFNSQEFKKILSISDCELMHQRESGQLKYVKKGRSFLYFLHDKSLLLKHPIADQLINWHHEKHPSSIDNFPKETESINSLIELIEKILIPVSREFNDITITYGFISAELNTYIQKNSASGTYPSIDQHAASELNKYNNPICKRSGLACDFYINGYETKMDKVMQFIVDKLNFDKIYYYGKERPLHVSVGINEEKHLQVMNMSEKGRRIPGQKAYGDKAKFLAKNIVNG
jgi:hypothetical protein